MSDRPLDNPINWSFRVGRLAGIEIRVHILFVLCAVLMLSLEFPKHGGAASISFFEGLTRAFGSYVILFSVVLLHEFGHCFGARATGGEADEILIWPLGGLASTRPPHRPEAHLITTLAGPVVNIVICALTGVMLVLLTGTVRSLPLNPVHPTVPLDPSLVLFSTTTQMWLLRIFGISYLLLIFNLLPIFPLDGGRIVQAIVWRRSNFSRSIELATSTGMIGAILLSLFALFTDEPWLLFMIAGYGYITCWQTRRMHREQGEFGGGEFDTGAFRGSVSTEVDEPRVRRPGIIHRYRLKKAAARAERERLAEQNRQHEVEEVLKKVSQSGLSSLTAAERRILEEETRRRRAT